MIDDNALLARIEVVADVLSLPVAEIVAATVSEAGLIDFARRHGQSLDWLIGENVRNMIAKRPMLKVRPAY